MMYYGIIIIHGGNVRGFRGLFFVLTHARIGVPDNV